MRERVKEKERSAGRGGTFRSLFLCDVCCEFNSIFSALFFSFTAIDLAAAPTTSLFSNEARRKLRPLALALLLLLLLLGLLRLDDDLRPPSAPMRKARFRRLSRVPSFLPLRSPGRRRWSSSLSVASVQLWTAKPSESVGKRLFWCLRFVARIQMKASSSSSSLRFGRISLPGEAEVSIAAAGGLRVSA